MCTVFGGREGERERKSRHEPPAAASRDDLVDFSPNPGASFFFSEARNRRVIRKMCFIRQPWRLHLPVSPPLFFLGVFIPLTFFFFFSNCWGAEKNGKKIGE